MFTREGDACENHAPVVELRAGLFRGVFECEVREKGGVSSRGGDGAVVEIRGGASHDGDYGVLRVRRVLFLF